MKDPIVYSEEPANERPASRSGASSRLHRARATMETLVVREALERSSVSPVFGRAYGRSSACDASRTGARYVEPR